MTPTDVQWAVNVYNMTYAALLLVGGLLGARRGFRRVLLGGLAVGVLGAVLTALAPSYGLVVRHRSWLETVSRAPPTTLSTRAVSGAHTPRDSS